ncbi:MAG: cytochrome c [Actinomycetota bacterium]|nr:cytochrome c [Actinomycetota bacterium]
MRPRTLLPVVLLVLAGSACSSEPDTPLAEGKTVYADICSACHGASGEGGVGPALEEVATTWPTCTEQIEWITLGSDGWKEANGNTYGATNKPVEGGMPAQSSVLDPAQIASVAAFERTTYGGVPEATTLTECGLDATTDAD